jgi:hypothetical protein
LPVIEAGFYPDDRRRWPVVAVRGRIRMMPEKPESPAIEPSPEPARESSETKPNAVPKEIGGRDGPEPVRYGDWEKNGRCIDF